MQGWDVSGKYRGDGASLKGFFYAFFFLFVKRRGQVNAELKSEYHESIQDETYRYSTPIMYNKLVKGRDIQNNR